MIIKKKFSCFRYIQTKTTSFAETVKDGDYYWYTEAGTRVKRCQIVKAKGDDGKPLAQCRVLLIDEGKYARPLIMELNVTLLICLKFFNLSKHLIVNL